MRKRNTEITKVYGTDSEMAELPYVEIPQVLILEQAKEEKIYMNNRSEGGCRTCNFFHSCMTIFLLLGNYQKYRSPVLLYIWPTNISNSYINPIQPEDNPTTHYNSQGNKHSFQVSSYSLLKSFSGMKDRLKTLHVTYLQGHMNYSLKREKAVCEICHSHEFQKPFSPNDSQHYLLFTDLYVVSPETAKRFYARHSIKGITCYNHGDCVNMNDMQIIFIIQKLNYTNQLYSSLEQDISIVAFGVQQVVYPIKLFVCKKVNFTYNHHHTKFKFNQKKKHKKSNTAE